MPERNTGQRRLSDLILQPTHRARADSVGVSIVTKIIRGFSIAEHSHNTRERIWMATIRIPVGGLIEGERRMARRVPTCQGIYQVLRSCLCYRQHNGPRKCGRDDLTHASKHRSGGSTSLCYPDCHTVTVKVIWCACNLATDEKNYKQAHR